MRIVFENKLKAKNRWVFLFIPVIALNRFYYSYKFIFVFMFFEIEIRFNSFSYWNAMRKWTNK